MTTETDYRGKMRAVFLAAIMVVSVFGASVAFTGSAAAFDTSNVDNQNPYQGQDITFTGLNTSDGDTVDLRSVDSFNDSSGVQSSTSVEELVDDDGDGTISYDTGDLSSGDYFLLGTESYHDIDTAANGIKQADTFEVRVQEISTYDFDDGTVTDAGGDASTELEIESNRARSSYVVDAGGNLEDSDLADIHVTLENVDTASLGANNNFSIESGTAGGELDITAPAAFSGNVTPADYNTILSEFRDQVEFSESDTTEPLAFQPDDGISSFNVSADDLEELDDDEDDLQIDGTNEYQDLATPNEDIDINPFNALYINANDDEGDDPEDRVVMLDVGDTTADVNFNGIDSGDYTFNVNVVDTEASASDGVTVEEQNVDASFGQGGYEAGAGDIAEFDFTVSDSNEVWLQIGGADAEFVDVLYVDVDDTDEPVEVAVNTRLLGTEPANLDTGDVYDVSNNEDVESAFYQNNHGSDSPLDDGSPSGAALFVDDDTTQSYDEYVSELDISDAGADSQLARPLQAFDYDIQAAGDDVDDGLFDSSSGNGDANDQLDSAVLTLTPASIESVTTHTAPSESADEETNVSELVSDATAVEEIAVDDRLIVQVEATGLYGSLVAGADSDQVDPDNINFDRLSDGVSTDVVANAFDQEQISLDVEAESASGNTEPLQLALDTEANGDSDTYVLIGENQEQFFLVADTSSDDAFENGGAPDSDTSMTASLEYDADNEDDRYEFDGNGAFSAESGAENYPYLLQGETLSSSADLTLAPRSITFDNVNADEQVQAQASEEATISGTTNVAPGSDAELRVSSTDASSSFRLGNDVNITEDGSVTATFDLADQEVGDEFETDFRVGGSSIDTADGIVVEAIGTDDGEETNETDTDDGEEMDDGEEQPADDGETNETTDDGESTDDGTPGFGAVVALIALIGAALLAVRRQN